ncbi:arsenic transporter [Xylophilus rhododendri]|uniref:Arsenic transporter n=1 Tax=Xylophilus rhododendri TaxID=2697032 RepID=A0A857J6D7_9BURK|nr:arsenic transporter [Xylophilus rhododendri]QHI98582.1 arsenic transporter [Xylophilus rhododendri]
MLLDARSATVAIAAAATACVILRPARIPEFVWAVAGALLLLACGLQPWSEGLQAVAKGLDVYCFLVGMMLLSELGRREGLFDWLAGIAARHAKGSASRLFLWIYGAGTVVTVFMSNDATAVVLTPAVYAATRQAGVKPLPYLFACALIANAASFVLPISNPANLVVFGEQLPALLPWLRRFLLPSVAAIVATFLVLRWMFRAELAGSVQAPDETGRLGATGKLAAGAVVAMALVLLAASARGMELGLPALVVGAIATASVLLAKHEAPWPLLGGVSWGVLPLVAGLFVLVEGVQRSGLLQPVAEALRELSQHSPTLAAWAGGLLAAFGCNLVNNLPAGLAAGTVAQLADAPAAVRGAIAIGIDLGPNLSVTGSLATLLWLAAIRREGEDVSAWQFLKVGAVAMPVALLCALAAVAI